MMKYVLQQTLSQLKSLTNRSNKSPKLWLTISALLLRANGFVTGLFLSRFYGAETLAVYLIVVVTFSAATGAYAQLLQNSIIKVVRTESEQNVVKVLYLRHFYHALLFGVILTLVGCILIFKTLDTKDFHLFYGLVAGAVVSGVGQIVILLNNGLANSLGRELEFAKLSSVAALVSTLVGLCFVYSMGLNGAWLSLIFGFISQLFVAVLILRQYLGFFDKSVDQIKRLTSKADDEIIQGIPNALSIFVLNIVAWYCTVILVSQYCGLAEVAMLGVAIQFLTLILIPAGSWNGLMLRRMVDEFSLTSSVKSSMLLVYKGSAFNIFITGIIALMVFLMIPSVDHYYGFINPKFRYLLATTCVASLLMSVMPVIQCWMVAIGRQKIFAASVLLGCLFQFFFTYYLIEVDVLFALIGILVGSVSTSAISLILIRLGRL